MYYEIGAKNGVKSENLAKTKWPPNRAAKFQTSPILMK
jgi:hypothetical protein